MPTTSSHKLRPSAVVVTSDREPSREEEQSSEPESSDDKTERLQKNFNMAAIGAVIRASAISAMFAGNKHRGNWAVFGDCARIPEWRDAAVYG